MVIRSVALLCGVLARNSTPNRVGAIQRDFNLLRLLPPRHAFLGVLVELRILFQTNSKFLKIFSENSYRDESNSLHSALLFWESKFGVLEDPIFVSTRFLLCTVIS